MADYIKQYNEIRIVATGNGQMKLKFAVKMNDGKYHYVIFRKEDFDITEAFINSTPVPDARVVESPEELTEYFTQFKPTDSPAIVMTDTKDDFAQWKPVSPKGTVAVRQYVTPLFFHPSRVEIPLPADHSKVMDAAGGENVYESDVFWDPTEAMLAIWENATAKLKRIVDFCRKEEANEKKELAVGAARIDALLKFQEKTKSVEERISAKWNSMSTAEKAKALKITKKPVTKTKAKTKTKKK
jgi:hypothetical protein